MVVTPTQPVNAKHTFAFLHHKQDCVNFLSEHRCLSTAGIGLQKPSKEAVELLSRILLVRPQSDPCYRTRPALEAAGPHTVLGALCKCLRALRYMRSKKVCSVIAVYYNICFVIDFSVPLTRSIKPLYPAHFEGNMGAAPHRVLNTTNTNECA